MMQYKTHVLVITLAVATLVGLLLFKGADGRGQSRSGPKGVNNVKPTSSVRESTNSFSAVAAQNAVLRNELNWVFGGKPQRGWYLYTSLISRLIDTRHDAASEAFASDLAKWQRKSEISPTGILDDKSLYAMISKWQGSRLKNRTPATPDQLLTAPPSDFYDPERDAELRQVEHETYAAYRRLVAAALSDSSLHLHGSNGELASGEKYLKIISAFRTRDYQDQLRKKQPNAGSAGLAVNSPHFTGRALDLYVGGEPVETRDSNRAIQVQTPVYKWLVRNAERFGFRPYYYEPWHWEFVGR